MNRSEISSTEDTVSRFAYDTLSMRDSAVPMGFREILSLNYDNCHTTATVNDAFDVEFSDSIQENALSPSYSKGRKWLYQHF